MATNWIHAHLAERRDAVDPQEYAMALFYVRDDADNYERCRRALRDERVASWRGRRRA